jgi:hypothetical protein
VKQGKVIEKEAFLDLWVKEKKTSMIFTASDWDPCIVIMMVALERHFYVNLGRVALGCHSDVDTGKDALGWHGGVTFGGLQWGKNLILSFGSCSEVWRFCTNRAFALGPRKTTENLDLVGWSLALSNAVDLIPFLRHRKQTTSPLQIPVR